MVENYADPTLAGPPPALGVSRQAFAAAPSVRLIEPSFCEGVSLRFAPVTWEKRLLNSATHATEIRNTTGSQAKSQICLDKTTEKSKPTLEVRMNFSAALA